MDAIHKLCTYTDNNIFDNYYYIVSKTFPGFPALGEQNGLRIYSEVLKISNSVLQEREIWEMLH